MNPVLFLLLTLYFLVPQQVPAKHEGLSPEIEQLAALARSTPPEFAAATLIRIAQSGKVTDRSLQRKLLQDAFELAGAARYPFRLKYLGAVTDTREYSMSRALGPGFARLSLRVAAVKAMAAADRDEARRLFASTSIGELPSHPCQAALVEDVAEYYQLAGELARSERKPGRFLLDRIEAAASPLEMTAMIEAVLAVGLEKQDLTEVAGALTAALLRIQGDDRSFSAGLYDQLRSFDRLLQECRRKEVAAHGLLSAMRAYLARQFTAQRCSDTPRLTEGQMPAAQSLKAFDENLRAAGIPPLSDRERLPLKIEGSIGVHAYWEAPKTQPLLTGIRALRFDAGERRSLEQRQTPDWQQKLEEYLTKLEGWSENDEPSLADYLNQRATLNWILLDLAPPGPARAIVLASLFNFLERFAAQDETGLEWYVHASTAGRAENAGDRQAILEAYRNSRNPVLVLYAETERLLGPPTVPPRSRN